MAFRRLQARLNRLESHAHATMGQAQITAVAIREIAAGVAEELLDGVLVTLERRGSIWDWLTGKTTVLPFMLRIHPREDDDAKPEADHS